MRTCTLYCQFGKLCNNIDDAKTDEGYAAMHLYLTAAHKRLTEDQQYTHMAI